MHFADFASDVLLHPQPDQVHDFQRDFRQSCKQETNGAVSCEKILVECEATDEEVGVVNKPGPDSEHGQVLPRVARGRW